MFQYFGVYYKISQYDISIIKVSGPAGLWPLGARKIKLCCKDTRIYNKGTNIAGIAKLPYLMSEL